MWGIRSITKFFKPEPPPPPPPPPPPKPKPTEDTNAKIANERQQALQVRNKLERFEGEPPPSKPLTNDEQARRAAREVEQAYNSNPNVVISAPGQGRDPNQPSAQEAAAKKLREVTANQSPEVAALTIQYAKPTIDRIAIELGKTAKDNDGDYGDNKPKFDSVINDLAAAANKAASAPNGKAIVEQMAKSIVNNINKDDIGRFDEAFGKPIANGAGGELTAAVIKQLQAADRADQADDILQNVKDGINQLQDRAEDVSEKVAKYNEELSFLVQNGKSSLTEEQLESAIQAYKDENPEYAESLEEMDQIGVSILRAVDSFGSVREDFVSFERLKVAGAVKDLLDDDKTKGIIAQSPSATKEVERLMQKAENNPNEPGFLDNVAEVAGSIDDGKYLRETIFNKQLDAGLDNAYKAARNKDYAGVDRELRRLEASAEKLGYDNREFRNVTQQLGRIARAKSEKEVLTDLRVLARKIKSYSDSKPEVFKNNSQITNKVRRMGITLGAVGTGAAGIKAWNDRSAKNIAGAMIDAAGLTADVAQTEMVSKMLQNKAWYQGLPLEKIGKGFGVLSLAFDAFAIGNDLRKGDYAGAGFSAASAVGGAMMIFGGPVGFGVGAVVVGAAILGDALWNKHENSVKYETDGARAFWQGAGIKPEVAEEIIDNDGDGRSPVEVFTAMTTHLQADPKEFLDYVNTLSPDKVSDLVERAHEVDPTNSEDINDFENWMDDNGYKVPRMAILLPSEGGTFSV